MQSNGTQREKGHESRPAFPKSLETLIWEHKKQNKEKTTKQAREKQKGMGPRGTGIQSQTSKRRKT